MWSWAAAPREGDRADWPPPPDPSEARTLVHRARRWALWDDGSLTSVRGLGEDREARALTADAVSLIDAVWQGAGHAEYGAWARLARVERIVERELLGTRWPRPWEERLERLLVENVDGTREVLFLHATTPSERPSAARVWLGPAFPEGAAASLDRPEPALFYDLTSPVQGAKQPPKRAPGYLVVRPRAGCVTAFYPRTPEGFVRKDLESLRAVIERYHLEPRAVVPVWPSLHEVPLSGVAGVEAERWGVPRPASRESPEGLYLVDGERELGPCTNPWDVASILASRARAAGG